MKLWLVSRTDDISYDEYDSVVVAADTEEEAREISPNGSDWGWRVNPKVSTLTVEYLGTTNRKISGVILASFNAG